MYLPYRAGLPSLLRLLPSLLQLLCLPSLLCLLSLFLWQHSLVCLAIVFYANLAYIVYCVCLISMHVYIIVQSPSVDLLCLYSFLSCSLLCLLCIPICYSYTQSIMPTQPAGYMPTLSMLYLHSPPECMSTNSTQRAMPTQSPMPTYSQIYCEIYCDYLVFYIRIQSLQSAKAT